MIARSNAITAAAGEPQDTCGPLVEVCNVPDASHPFCWGCCAPFGEADEAEGAVDIFVPGIGTATAHASDATCQARALEVLRGPRSAIVARRLLMANPGDVDGWGRRLMVVRRYNRRGSGPLSWVFLLRDRGTFAVVDQDGEILDRADSSTAAAHALVLAGCRPGSVFDRWEFDNVMNELCMAPRAVGA